MLIVSIVASLFMVFVDVWVFKGNLNSSSFYISVFSDIVGAPIIASLFVLIAWLPGLLEFSVTEHRSVSGYISALAPAFLASIVFLVQYYVLSILFSPVLTYVDMKVNPNSAFTFIFDKDMKELITKEVNECNCNKSNEIKDMRFLSGSFEGRFSAQGNLENGVLNWSATSPEKFKLYVNVYDGCYTVPTDKLPKNDTKALIFEDVNSLSALLDTSMIDLSTPSIGANIDFPESKMVQGWVTKEKDGTFEVQRFSPKGTTSDFWSNSASLEFVVLYPLFDFQRKSVVVPQAKYLTMVVNRQESKMHFNSEAKSKDDTICKVVDLSQGMASLSNIISHTNIIKVKFRLARIGNDIAFYTDKRNVLSIAGLNGWYSAQNISRDKVKNLIGGGQVQGISVNGNIDYLTLNGRKVEDNQNHVFTLANANLVVDADQDATLTIKGFANSIWVDQKRLTPTRWEGFDGATQSLLIGLAISVLSGIIWLMKKGWKDNSKINL